MSTKSTRSGGKYRGTHTTVIPAAAIVADIAHSLEEVTGVVLGYITTGLSPSGRGKRIKIGFGVNGSVTLQVRGNTSQQELRVMTRCVHATKFSIAGLAREKGFAIAFVKKH